MTDSCLVLGNGNMARCDYSLHCKQVMYIASVAALLLLDTQRASDTEHHRRPHCARRAQCIPCDSATFQNSADPSDMTITSFVGLCIGQVAIEFGLSLAGFLHLP